MMPLLERLKDGDTLVADGAMGTMLFQMNVETGNCPESINLTQPEVLAEVARRYFEAGAEIVQTNTFGASPMKLGVYGLADKAAEINRKAVEAVRSAVGDRAYVSGSCGPCGKMLKPYGDADADDVAASFRIQAEALTGAGVDVVCVETMTDLNEATLAVKAVKEVSPTTPVMATMTFDASPRGFHTIMGVTIEKAAVGLREAGADIVGSNCGNGIENMIEIARMYRACCDLPIIIQSNAGLPEMKDGRPSYSESPEFMAEKARELLELGVSIIGGCCGTTPEHIKAMRKIMS